MPRTHDPLNDKRLRGLRPGTRPIDLRDGEVRGLIVTILPSGRKQFSVRYRFQGRQHRLLLGEYPGTTLAEARKRSRRAQSLIDDGRDPVGERQAAKAERTDTVTVLVAEYMANHARKFKRPASANEDERMLRVDVLPFWRDRSVRDLTRRDVRVLVERVAERAPTMANRVLAVVRKMLNFAVDRDWIDGNPASRVAKLAPERSRDRVLTPEEIRRIWRLLSHLPTTAERPAPGRKRATGQPDDPICPVSAPLAALLKAQLLLAQRGGEVARMRWLDLDLESGWWTIPGSITKNGEAHRVPLIAEASALIQAQASTPEQTRGEYVFTGIGGRTVFYRAKKAPSRIARLLGIDFRGRDLRRTAATYMAQAGVPREHIAFVLHHVQHGARATKIYDRYNRDAEKRVALETWGRVLQGILTQQGTGAIVPFAKGA
jgi:integrase